jgi:hypothetical protein
MIEHDSSRETGLRYDAENRFLGGPGRSCEHRTVGSHRAWCLTCVEWCYPKALCVRCECASKPPSSASEPNCCEP